MHQGVLITGASVFVLSAFCAHAQVREASEDAVVSQAARAVQVERAKDAADLQDALATASAEQKAELVEQYVARDRARVAEIREQREVSIEPVLFDRAAGIEDAAEKERIQKIDRAASSEIELASRMRSLSPDEATLAFLTWEQSPERVAALLAREHMTPTVRPVLKIWVAAEQASAEEQALVAARNELNGKLAVFLEQSENLAPLDRTKAFLLLESECRIARDTVHQIKPVPISDHESQD